MAFDPIGALREWKQRVASLQQRWRGARREIEQLRKENEQLRRREKQLEKEREQLRQENEKLTMASGTAKPFLPKSTKSSSYPLPRNVSVEARWK